MPPPQLPPGLRGERLREGGRDQAGEHGHDHADSSIRSLKPVRYAHDMDRNISCADC
jgi:hypothetical protein